MPAYRPIQAKIDKDTIVVNTEFGYKLHYKIIPFVNVDPATKYEDGNPDFTSSLSLQFLKLEVEKGAKSQDEIAKVLRERNIIPPGLDYDFFYVGFVYADDSDPNNHKWWLDFRKDDMSVLNLFTDSLKINSPATTASWFANGVWHGRFKVTSDMLEFVKQEGESGFFVKGRRPARKISQNICSPDSMPKGAKYIRLRYNIRQNFWYAAFLDKSHEQIEEQQFGSIICDAPMEGVVHVADGKWRVSSRIDVKDVAGIAQIANSLIITGK